jgi:hypothetical protein
MKCHHGFKTKTYEHTNMNPRMHNYSFYALQIDKMQGKGRTSLLHVGALQVISGKIFSSFNI